MLSDITNLFTFMLFPESIRSTIYSNNLIERQNKHLKNAWDKKQFSPITSLGIFICTYTSEYNAKFFGIVHRDFSTATISLQSMFNNRE